MVVIPIADSVLVPLALLASNDSSDTDPVINPLDNDTVTIDNVTLSISVAMTPITMTTVESVTATIDNVNVTDVPRSDGIYYISVYCCLTLLVLCCSKFFIVLNSFLLCLETVIEFCLVWYVVIV